MKKRIYPVQSVRSIQEAILNKHGKKLYGDTPHEIVTRRFNLSLMKLKDILHVCGPEAQLLSCEPHLRHCSGDIHEALTPERLLSFMKIARMGRAICVMQNRDPALFIDSEVLSLAKRLCVHFQKIEVSV